MKVGTSNSSQHCCNALYMSHKQGVVNSVAVLSCRTLILRRLTFEWLVIQASDSNAFRGISIRSMIYDEIATGLATLISLV
jgi:hypothetical protein